MLQFTAGASNAVIEGNFIVLSNADLNAKPGLMPVVQQLWTGVYNPHSVGVWFITGAKPAEGRWSIFNEDQKSMPVGAVFNVMMPVPNGGR